MSVGQIIATLLIAWLVLCLVPAGLWVAWCYRPRRKIGEHPGDGVGDVVRGHGEGANP